MDIIISFILVVPSAECAYCAAAAPLPHLEAGIICIVDGMKKYERFNAYPRFFTVSANFVLRSRDSVPRMLPF